MHVTMRVHITDAAYCALVAEELRREGLRPKAEEDLAELTGAAAKAWRGQHGPGSAELENKRRYFARKAQRAGRVGRQRNPSEVARGDLISELIISALASGPKRARGRG
jgi:hypothetical protein